VTSTPAAFVCAACGEPTRADPCDQCQASPLVDQRYRLDRKCGAGTYAITWSATRLATGERVCIKEMSLRPDHPRKVLQLMRREVAVLQQLDHPGIPKYIEHVEDKLGKVSVLWLVTDYIDGVNLREASESRRFTEGEVLELLDELLQIVTYLHDRSPPVIHRDIKPANVMRGVDGRVFLVDFGSVRDALVDPSFGGSTFGPGTLGYMSPESYMGDVVPQTDLFGLGATAVALLCRVDAGELTTGPGTLEWEQRVDVSGPTRALLRSLLAAKPELRPSSATAARDRIHQILKVLDSAPFEPSPARRPETTALVVDNQKSSWMLAFALLNLFTIQLAGPVVWYAAQRRITDLRDHGGEPDGLLLASRVVAILGTLLIFVPFL